MPQDYYLPRTDKEKALWLKNFSTKFTGFATTLGFTAADATAVTNDSNMFSYMLEQAEIMKAEAQERVAYKNILRDGPIGATLSQFPSMPTLPAPPVAVPAGIFPRIAKMVQRIKNHPNYTEAIGRDLGIIGSEESADRSTMKPQLKLVMEGSRPVVKWVKGKADGIKLFVNRNDGRGFQFLAHDTFPDYIDTFEGLQRDGQISHKWDYKGIYVLNDEVVGQESDIATISFSPSSL